MTVRINKQKINLREKLTEFEDKVNFDEVVRGLGKYDGNVGIGTTNPGYKLDIYGSFGSNAGAGLRLRSTATDDNSIIHEQADGTSWFTGQETSNPNDYEFWYSNGSSYSHVMHLDNSGNVGIGTKNPTTKLTVNGMIYGTTTAIFGNLSVSSDVQTNADKELISTSDKRLKNDLGDCEYGLNEVLQVQPKKYTWKSGPEDQKPTIGFFAQDVHAIMPEAAPREAIQNENGEDDYRWGFHSQTIIAALVNATKEQQSIIEDLKSRIETLESK